MTGKMIPIPRHASPCQGPWIEAAGNGMIFPVAGNGNGSQRRRQQTTPSGCPPMQGRSFGTRSGDTLAPQLYFPSNGMQHRHNRMMPLQPPSFPHRGRMGAFFVRNFQRRRLFLLIPSRNQECSVFTAKCIFFTVCERKLLKPQYLWQTRDANPSYI